MTMGGRAVAVALAAGLTAGEPGAQEPEVPIFRAGVRVVRVDVSVTDGRDRPLADLAAEEFLLLEDGVPQTVTTAQFLRRDGTRQTDVDEALAIRSREHAESEARRDDVRVFAIFLDDYHVDRDQLITLRVQEALKRFVQEFGPNDLLTVMDPLTPLSALRYTRAFDEVQAQVREFEGRRGVYFPTRSVMEEAQLQSRNPAEIRATVTLSAVEALVAHLGGLGEGRKSVLFVSQGPPVNLTYAGTEARLQGIVQAANRGNVTIHAFDPRPLGSAAPGGAYALSRLANETGGRVIANTNEPARLLKQAVADTSAYYLLGYVPTRDADDGRFHRIEVTVKRPGARVIARRGYWAPTPAESRAPAPPPLEPRQQRALTELVEPSTGRVADVWLGFAPGGAGKTAVTVAWELDPGRGADRGRPEALETAVLRGGERGGDDADSVVPEARIGLGESRHLELAVGEAVVWRFAVLDGAGVLDRWEEAMTVPDLRSGRVTLATPVVYRARTAHEFRTMEAGTGIAPTAGRRFRRSDRVRVVARWHADGSPVAVTADLLSATGKFLVELPIPAESGDRVQFTLPVSSLAQATYVLRVRAEADGGMAEERVAFEVVP